MENFNRIHRLGAVFGSSMGFWMSNRNCRAPVFYFIPKDRLLRLGFTPTTKTFFPGAPDLAVEILSPNNIRSEIDERLRDFFSSGTQIAWILHPDDQFVEICHSLVQRQLLGTGASFSGEELLPDFIFPIADLFKGWDWENER